MWTTEQVFVAVLGHAASSWHYDLRGGECGTGLLAGEILPADSMSVDQRHLSLVAVEGT